MRKITEQELKEILEKHLKWLNGESGGDRADLSKVDLSHVDLSNVTLDNADLHNADLYNAILHNVTLSNADLSNADLYNADLFKADLSNARLYNANLSNANLSNANLEEANLSNADLSNADLYNANLHNANLYKADLSNASLFNARLNENEQCRLGISLQEPRMAYKRCGDYIVQIILPKGAIVFSINNNGCRTNKATPIAILELDGTISKRKSISSDYDNDFRYKLMEEIEIQDFNLMYNVEYASGIHFFWDFESARDYK